MYWTGYFLTKCIKGAQCAWLKQSPATGSTTTRYERGRRRSTGGSKDNRAAMPAPIPDKRDAPQ